MVAVICDMNFGLWQASGWRGQAPPRRERSEVGGSTLLWV